MPVTRYKVSFAHCVVRLETVWGEASWRFEAIIDGVTVSTPTQRFSVMEGQRIEFPSDWSRVIDVGTRDVANPIRITLKGWDIDDDLGLDLELGQVAATVRDPYLRQAPLNLTAVKPASGETSFTAELHFSVEAVTASTDLAGPQRIAVVRAPNGSTAFSTAAGHSLSPRVEVCPVIPVPWPSSPTKPPTRPALPVGTQPGTDLGTGVPPTLSAGAAHNFLINPAFIPFLRPTHPNLDSLAARLGVTWVAPGNLDTGLLCWKISSGPLAFVGDRYGPEVKLRGTQSGADSMAVVEVRWARDDGPLLCTFRAYTGAVKHVKYRINRVLGPGGVGSATDPLIGAADMDSLVDMVNRLYWQSGIQFVPDDNVTCFEGAVATAVSGVFNVQAASAAVTANVSSSAPSPAARLNFRPGVVNIALVRSAVAPVQAWACYIQGVTGAPVTLSGSPSSSWFPNNGIPPDTPASPVTMRTFGPNLVPVGDEAAFVAARAVAVPGFSAADLARLHACTLPSNWGPAGIQYAVNLAHELGHVLGLHHRGKTNDGPLSVDGVDAPDATGMVRGLPWFENVMSYGYAGNVAGHPRALDIDLIQTQVIRRHPAVH